MIEIVTALVGILVLGFAIYAFINHIDRTNPTKNNECSVRRK